MENNKKKPKPTHEHDFTMKVKMNFGCPICSSTWGTPYGQYAMGYSFGKNEDGETTLSVCVKYYRFICA